MPSTYSTSMRFELIATGEQSGTWGTTTNSNVGTLLEQAIGGYQSVAISDANYTLTTANGAPDEARNMVLRITGTISAQRNVSCPSGIEKLYLVENATTGGQSIVFKTVSGTGVTIPNGATSLIYVNGTNAVEFIQSPVPDAQGGTGATSAANARTALGLGTAAVQNTGTSGATVPLLNGANVWSGAQTFGTGSGDAFVNINGGAASTRGFVTASNGSARWLYGVDNSAESGSNAGSSFFFNRHDDSGTYIDTPLSISRATGVTALQSLSLNTDLAITHGGTGASDAATARTNLGLGSIATQNANAVAITGGAISGITDLAVADGGTGASTAAQARTNLGLGTAATQNTGTSGANVPLLNGANTWSTAQTFSSSNSFVNAAGGVTVNIDGTAATNRGVYFKTAASNRWVLGANATAEAGANAGSDFFIYRYDDSGVFIDAPFSVGRANGTTTITDLNATGTPTATTASAYTNTTQIATTAQVYSTVTTVPQNYQTGTAYTIVLSDAGKVLLLDNAGAITLTIPTNATAAIAVNTRIDLVQWGAGQVTVVGASGVTLFSAGSRTKTGERYAGCSLLKTNTDTWLLMGNTA